jgi:LacI family transcriptional regulator
MASPQKRKTKRAATLADVGRAAGVSAMAVSAVMNNAQTSSRIATATRMRILEAAQRLHYRPNAAARALAARRMNTLGVATVVEGQDLNQYFLEVFNGVMATAAARNQNVTVFTLHDWKNDIDRLPGFCDGRIDGLILVGPTFTPEGLKVLPEHTPSVALHSNVALPNSVNLETDEDHGAFEAVSYLIKQGHRRILHIAGPSGLVGAERRARGYERALREHNLPVDPSLKLVAGYSAQAGSAALKDWFRSGNRKAPDAIFCANDYLASGCLEVLGQQGLKVPDDVSIVGFDDTLVARATLPQLTTVRQPLREMGGRAVEILLEQIDAHLAGGEHSHPHSIVFPTELVQRASVAHRRG